MSLQIGLRQRKLEHYRGKRYEKAVGKVCNKLKRDRKTEFLLSPDHVEVIPLLASVNVANC